MTLYNKSNLKSPECYLIFILFFYSVDNYKIKWRDTEDKGTYSSVRNECMFQSVKTAIYWRTYGFYQKIVSIKVN